MAALTVDEKIIQLENNFKEILGKYKKEADNALTTVKNHLIKRVGALEEAAKQWKQEKKNMQKEIQDLQTELASLKAHEEGEITEANKETLKMEIMESVSKTMESKMEAAKEGWVQVVKKTSRKRLFRWKKQIHARLKTPQRSGIGKN